MSNNYFNEGAGYISASGLSSADVSNIKLVDQPAWNSLHILNQGVATTSSPTFFNVSASNALKLLDSGFSHTIDTTVLTADHTFTLPNADLSLTAYSAPDQPLNIASSPSFANVTSGNYKSPTTNFVANNTPNLTIPDTSNITIGGSSGLIMSAGAAYNVLIGSRSGRRLTTGAQNVLLGVSAGCNGITGDESLGMSSGSDNIGIGVEALGGAVNSASYNVGIGTQALFLTTSGNLNVGVGYLSGNRVSIGTCNLIAGGHAGVRISSGSYNTVLGYSAATNHWGGAGTLGITTGQYNIAVGPLALGLSAGVSGSHNIGIGFSALANVTTGIGNIAIGESAALAAISGAGNVCIGPNSNVAATVNSQVCLGNSAISLGDSGIAVGVSTSTTTNSIAIGAGTSCTGANAIAIGAAATSAANITTIGNSSTTACRLYGTIGLDAPTALTSLTLYDGVLSFTGVTSVGYRQKIGNWYFINCTVSWTAKPSNSFGMEVGGFGINFTSGVPAAFYVPTVASVSNCKLATTVNNTDAVYLYKDNAGNIINMYAADMVGSGSLTLQFAYYKA